MKPSYDLKAEAAVQAALAADRVASLRDAFAGAAMSAIIARGGEAPDFLTEEQWRRDVAQQAYSYADAMLEERAVKEERPN